MALGHIEPFVAPEAKKSLTFTNNSYESLLIHSIIIE